MIDDRQTCDVCGEDFNEARPSHEHEPAKKKEEVTKGQGVDVSKEPPDDQTHP